MKLDITIETDFSRERREATARLTAGAGESEKLLFVRLPDGTEEDAARAVLIVYAGGDLPSDLAATEICILA
jgi:CRISPR/Cas system-associated protein Cas10 (large subunit of type III CRISPR-Cas system)